MENLSLRIYGLLWLFIEILVIFFTTARFYHKSQFRDMYKRSLKLEIPESYRWKIDMVIKYHFFMANVFVVAPVLYLNAFDWVQMGDAFTVPHVDVLPFKTTNVTVHACKYILYILPVYLAQFELCFLNVTFMYSPWRDIFRYSSNRSKKLWKPWTKRNWRWRSNTIKRCWSKLCWTNCTNSYMYAWWHLT